MVGGAFEYLVGILVNSRVVLVMEDESQR